MKTTTATEAAAAVVIGIFTEDGLDQIVTTESELAKERRDLINMGCRVDVYRAPESTLYHVDSWIRDGRSFATARARVESGHLTVEDARAEAPRPTVEEMQAEAQKAGGLIFPPASLNGLPVTAIQSHGNGFFTVMAIRDAHNAPDHARLVVATWWRELGASWAWGHYIEGNALGATEAQAEAESVFRTVAARNRKRGAMPV